MATKNKKDTQADTSATVDKELAEILQRKAELEAKKELLAEEKRQKIQALIAGLPEYMGVATMEEALALIRGESKGPRKARTTVTAEMRTGIIDSLKAGDKTGDQIAANFGVSAQTVAKIKRDAKLTRSHQVAA